MTAQFFGQNLGGRISLIRTRRVQVKLNQLLSFIAESVVLVGHDLLAGDPDDGERHWDLLHHNEHKTSKSGPDPINKISRVNLRFARFKHSDWLKKV